MKNKNTFLTLIAFLTLGFGSCYGAAAEGTEAPKAKTIVSVTRTLKEEFEKLQNKLAALQKVKKEEKVLEGFAEGNAGVIRQQLQDLVKYGVSEFQTLTGLEKGEAGKLRIDEDFHGRIIQQYREGLERLLEAKKELSSQIGKECFPEDLLEERINYYGQLLNLYKSDSENFFSETSLFFWTTFYSKNLNLAFLTVLVEEENDVKVAATLLREIQRAALRPSEKPSEVYELFSTPEYKKLRGTVTKKLSLAELENLLEDLENKRYVVIDPELGNAKEESSSMKKTSNLRPTSGQKRYEMRRTVQKEGPWRKINPISNK